MAKTLLKDRLKKRREEIKAKSQSGNIFFIKADTSVRVRIIGGDENEEFLKEVTQFYLGQELKGIISPVTIKEPCGIMESYDELKSSKNDDDKTLAKTFVPKQRYLAFCIIYKDEAGKVVDEQNSPKWVLCTGGMYQDIIDLYLDETDWGDMTDRDNGYDLKFSRIGSGKTDTEYSVSPCKNTPFPKAFKNKEYDLDKELRNIIPSYEETKNIIAQFLNLPPEEEEDTKNKSKKKLLRKTDAD
jgi:hypothetical protein